MSEMDVPAGVLFHREESGMPALPLPTLRNVHVPHYLTTPVKRHNVYERITIRAGKNKEPLYIFETRMVQHNNTDDGNNKALVVAVTKRGTCKNCVINERGPNKSNLF